MARVPFLLAASAVVIALGAAPRRAGAHAVVTRASLRDTTVVAEVASEATLEFNSAIEAKLTKVTLVDARGEERSLALVAGDHPSNVLVIALPALPAGPYGLRYKVLAADGHVTESVLRFHVTMRP
jgi:hypothetical protein